MVPIFRRCHRDVQGFETTIKTVILKRSVAGLHRPSSEATPEPEAGGPKKFKAILGSQ